jgi:hypothetical protein
MTTYRPAWHMTAARLCRLGASPPGLPYADEPLEPIEEFPIDDWEPEEESP